MRTLFLIFISSMAFGQKLTQQVFVGKINNKFGITLTLTTDDNLIYGQVVYKKEPIQIIGSKDGNSITLREFDTKGLITGSYFGEIKGNVFSGSWYGSKKDAPEMKFSATKTTEKQVDKPIGANLTGTYHYKYAEDNGVGTIEIHQINKDKIAFAGLSLTHGPAYNQAIVDKVSLKLSNSQAIYANNEYGNCKFKLSFAPTGLSIDYVGDAYECGFGHNATLSGSYIKINSKIPKFELNGN